jgi:hypothetical protein
MTRLPPARVPTIGGQPYSSMTDEDERLPAGRYVLDVAETVDQRDPDAGGARRNLVVESALVSRHVILFLFVRFPAIPSFIREMAVGLMIVHQRCQPKRLRPGPH